MCLKLALVWFIFVSLSYFCLVWAECSHPTFWFSAKWPRKQQQKTPSHQTGRLHPFGCECRLWRRSRGLFCCCSRQKRCSGKTKTWHCRWQIRRSKSAHHSSFFYFFFRFLISLLAQCERYWWDTFILYHNRGKGPLLWYHRLVHFMGGVSERVLILWEISTLIITFPFALLSYFLGRHFPCLL